jgi:hypothetical protein
MMFIEREKAERLRKIQREQRRLVLELLRERGSVTNQEFIRMGIPRVAARVEELRKAGHIIDTVNEGHGVFRYVYRGFNPIKEEVECTFHVMRDGETRSKRSWAGSVETACRIVERSIQAEPVDTFVFARGVQKSGKLVIFALRDGRPEVLELRDGGESRKKIAELMRECEFVVARRA